MEHIFKYMIFQKRHYGVIMGEAANQGVLSPAAPVCQMRHEAVASSPL